MCIRQPARPSRCATEAMRRRSAAAARLQLPWGAWLQGLAMLITVSIFDWRAEAKRAMVLLGQHERAVDGEECHELLHDEVAEPQRS